MQTAGRQILVPIDFSPHSLLAAKAAAIIAAHRGCRVKLLHALEQNEDKNEATSRIKAFVADIADEQPATIDANDIAVEVTEGIPEEVILQIAKDQEPELMVMGTRRVALKEQDMVGSVAAEVIDECRVPVLTVPDNTDIGILAKPRAIAYLCMMDADDFAALDVLNSLFAETAIHLTLIHVPPRRMRLAAPADQWQEMIEQTRKRYPDWRVTANRITTHTLSDDIARIAGETPFAILSTANRRKNVVSRILNPSIGHKLLFGADCPVLSLPV